MHEKNKYKILFLTRYLAECIFSSVFPLYLKRLDYTGTQIGTILSFSPLFLVLALPFWSRFDSGNARKKVLILAAIFTIVLQIIISIPLPYFLLIIFAILYAIFKAPFYPSIESMSTIFAIENKIEYSSLRAFGSLGYLLAVVLGAIMIDSVDFRWILASSSILFLVLIMTSFSLKPLKTDSLKVKNKGNYKLLFTNVSFLLFLVAQVLAYSMFILNSNFELLYLDFRGAPSYYFGISTLGRVGLEIVCFNLLIRSKISFKKLFVFVPFMLLVQSISFFLKMPVSLILLFTISTGFSGGVLIYLNNKYISRIVRPENITIATYTMAIIQNIFIAIFVFVGGVIIDKLGIHFVYLMSGISFAIAIVFISLCIKNFERDATSHP